MNLENKIIMVSGGTGELGQFLCKNLLEKGANISSHFRSREKKEKLLAFIPEVYHKKLLLIEGGFSEENLKNWLNRTIDHFHKIDAAIHTIGGIHPKKAISEMDFTTWKKSIELNLDTSFLFANTVLPVFLKQKKGKLVIISALAGLKGEAQKGAYGAAKAGLIRLAETISEETKNKNIQTNVVLPSILKTPANLSWGTKEDIKKWVDPDDFAKAIIFLLSKAGDSITGATIPITGSY